MRHQIRSQSQSDPELIVRGNPRMEARYCARDDSSQYGDHLDI